MNPRIKAPASVVAAAVTAITGSLFILLGASFGAIGLYITPTAGSAPSLPPMAVTMAECVIIFIFALGIFGIFAGVGLLRLKNWARISTLIWSGVTVVFCALIVALFAFSPFPTPPNAPANMASFVRGVVIVFYGLPLAIGIWWLTLFNKKSVAAQFVGPAGGYLDASGFPAELVATAKPECPLPVMVFAGFLLISSLSIFFIFLFPMPILLFGHPVRGLPGVTLWIISCLSCAAAGIGLLRLRAWGYWLALGLQIFWLLSGIATLASPKYSLFMEEILTSTRLRLGQAYSGYTAEQLKPYSYLGLAFPLLITVLLLVYRSRFLSACAPAQPRDPGGNF